MQLPQSYSEDMPSDEKNIEILKGQKHMIYDYQLTSITNSLVSFKV